LKISIEWVYRTKNGTEAVFHSEEMSPEMAVSLAEDMEKTGRTKRISFFDISGTSWTLKELKKYLKEIETEPHHITVYFDGGFDRGSKKAGLGCVVYYKQNNKSFRLRKNALVDQLENNNEAEYAALSLCLQELELLGVRHMPVVFCGDAQVVINQLTGEWPCYEEELAKWMDRIESKLEKMGIQPEFVLKTRNDNKEADQLASQALRGIEITSTIETD